MNNKIAMIAIAALLIGGVGVAVMKSGGSGHPASGAQRLTPNTVRMPQLGLLEKRGEQVFNANCQKCHGEKATGSDQGPPLLHRYYVPSHHADGAFALAMKNGVRPHHWSFGPMPPQPQIDAEELKGIVAYVRALQRANGFAN